MVSARFRADETSANLTWMGLTADTRRQRPAAAVRLAARSGVRVAAGHIIRDRSVLGVSRTVAISQHVPPSRFPGSTTVIPPVNAADLPNRQGPCLRNSSPSTPLRRQKCLFPDRGNETSSSIKAVTTHKSDGCQTSSQPGLYHPARPRHHPPPTAVRDGKRSNSFPNRPLPCGESPTRTQEGCCLGLTSVRVACRVG